MSHPNDPSTAGGALIFCTVLIACAVAILLAWTSPTISSVDARLNDLPRSEVQPGGPKE